MAKKNKGKNKASKSSSKKVETKPVVDPVVQQAEDLYRIGNFSALGALEKTANNTEVTKIRERSLTEMPVWAIGIAASCVVLLAALLTLTTG